MSRPGAELRAQAARSLHTVLAGRSLRAELDLCLPSIEDRRDRALYEALLFAALRHRRRYEWTLAQWMRHPLRPSQGELQALLLLGLAQLDALGLPAHAAVAASSEAARVLRQPQRVGLVNALLRRASREPWPRCEEPAIVHSHPDWLSATLQRDWPGQWAAILAANNVSAPLWLRVNRLRTTPAQAAERLRAGGIACTRPAFAEQALCLPNAPAPNELPGWAEGEYSVQDLSAQLAAAALAPVPPQGRILDACAAPGGKSTHLLEMQPTARVLALDVDPQRLARAKANAARLGLDRRLEIRVADATTPNTWWDGEPFAAIVLDAPCSATGIIRRQPDIKWHRRAQDIPALIATQRKLLHALWPLLKPGGQMLYTTCSLLAAENRETIAQFLSRSTDARALSLPAHFGHPSGAGRQRLPGEDGGDGFFYALLAKAG